MVDTSMLEELETRLQQQDRFGGGAIPQALIDVRNQLKGVSGAAAAGLLLDTYRATLLDALREGEDGLSALVVSSISGFLQPLQQEASARAKRARAAGSGLDGRLTLGPVTIDLLTRSVSVPDQVIIAHLPINGLDMALDAGALHAQGSGYLLPQEQAAGGVVNGVLGPVGVTVAAQLATDRGFASVLALLRADFHPTGLQLGLGFSLDAVGGMFGINRGVNTEELKQRIVDGSAMDALFGGTTSSRHAVHSTLNALGRMFPHSGGEVVVGPTMRLGWLNVAGKSLVRLDLGAILLLPRGRLLVPGRAILDVAGPGIPLVHLRADLLGEVDVAGRRMSLDAAVVDSQVLGAFRLGGTAAAFFSWGDPALVVLTLGGFYPGFDPSPAQVPPQQRISLALTSPLPGLRLSASGYVAATTGTLQLGGSLTAAYDIDVAAVRGTIAGDALIQLSPLWFTATLRGSASIEAFEHEVASVDCTATLTGPGPLTLTVTASTSILWEDVGGTVDFDLSGGVGADRTPADSLKGAVERALSEPGNLACETGSDPLVRPSMPTQPPAFPLVSPVGAVVWKQQGFPLGSAVQKAEGRILHTAATITITAPPGAGAVNQRLATSAFLDLTDSLALGVAPYQDHQVGVSIPVTPEQSPATSEVTTDFRTVVLPINTGNTFSSPFQPNAAGVSTALRAATGAPALMAGPPPLTRVLEEAWTVVDPAGGTPGKTTPAAALARAATDPQVVAVPLLAWET